MWVVGRHPRLFDYFLPERWRRTPCQSLSEEHEVYYTVTKDNVHIVWKTSRVGEKFLENKNGKDHSIFEKCSINSPFEEFAIAHFLSENGIPTVYIRAIYMTGSLKMEKLTDPRPYKSHKTILGIDNQPILRTNRNYITIRGYFNGTDSWIASHEGMFYQPFDLDSAKEKGILKYDECLKILDITRSRLRNVGYNGIFLEPNDILISLDPTGKLIKDNEGLPEARICNLELIHKE